jgi:hypothetical protein
LALGWLGFGKLGCQKDFHQSRTDKGLCLDSASKIVYAEDLGIQDFSWSSHGSPGAGGSSVLCRSPGVKNQHVFPGLSCPFPELVLDPSATMTQAHQT